MSQRTVYEKVEELKTDGTGVDWSSVTYIDIKEQINDGIQHN
jgi:hypothetical protein